MATNSKPQQWKEEQIEVAMHHMSLLHEKCSDAMGVGYGPPTSLLRISSLEWFILDAFMSIDKKHGHLNTSM